MRSDTAFGPGELRSAPARLRRAAGLPEGLGLLTLLGLWLVVVRFLGAQWNVYEQYRYGWAVPVLSIWFAWRRAGGGGTREAKAGRGTASEWLLCGLFVSLAVLYLPVRVIQEANPVWRAASYGLCLTACGLTLLLLHEWGGWSWVRRFSFPVFFMLAGVPWPSGLENAIIQTLSRWNTAVTVELLGLIGFPVLAHGNVIETAGGPVGVEEACSGIRSLQASVMLALAFGEFYRLRPRARLMLVGAGAAFAFLFNLARTSLLTWVACRQGVAAVEAWHDPAGVTILVGCFLLLWWVAVRARAALGQPENGELRTEADPTVSPPAEALGGSAAETETPKQRAGETPPRRSLTKLAMSLILLVLGSELAAEAWFRTRQHPQNAALAWAVVVPDGPTRYRDLPLTDRVRTWLGCDEYVSIVWESYEGYRWQLFYFRWLPAYGLSRPAEIALSRTHRPDHCLPASGRTLLRELDVQLVEVGPLRLPFRAYQFDDQGTPLLVFHCLWEDGTQPDQIANLRENARARLAAAWAGSRGVGQRSLQVAVWGYRDVEAAKAALAGELKHLLQTERNGKATPGGEPPTMGGPETVR